jgi:hypothetical protein
MRLRRSTNDACSLLNSMASIKVMTATAQPNAIAPQLPALLFDCLGL